MEDIINLTSKQIRGLMYHLNEATHLQQVHGRTHDRVITEGILTGAICSYNSPNIPDSIEEEEK
jgi:hypothetical protein